MSYTNQTLVENYLKRSLTAKESAVLSVLIGNAKSIIDDYANRSFEATEAVARYFDGSGDEQLEIDEAIEITSIEVVDTTGTTVETIDEAAYHVTPYNSLPIYALIKWLGTWTYGRRNYKVTAKWGYSETAPEIVQYAATRIVAYDLVNPQQLKSESIEGYSRTFGDETTEIRDLIEMIPKRIML